MNLPPPIFAKQRATRVQMTDIIPAVLRFEDGRRVPSQLQVVSFTGGLLSLPQPVDQGSQVKLMFLTGAGSVLGGAEMLNPIGSTRQPFRFVSLAHDDQRRLAAVIQSSQAEAPQPHAPQAAAAQNQAPPATQTPEVNAEQLWIEKLRAASPLPETLPQGRFFKRAVGAVGLITLALASAMYLIHPQWLK